MQIIEFELSPNQSVVVVVVVGFGRGYCDRSHTLLLEVPLRRITVLVPAGVLDDDVIDERNRILCKHKRPDDSEVLRSTT